MSTESMNTESKIIFLIIILLVLYFIFRNTEGFECADKKNLLEKSCLSDAEYCQYVKTAQGNGRFKPSCNKVNIANCSDYGSSTDSEDRELKFCGKDPRCLVREFHTGYGGDNVSYTCVNKYQTGLNVPDKQQHSTGLIVPDYIVSGDINSRGPITIGGNLENFVASDTATTYRRPNYVALPPPNPR